MSAEAHDSEAPARPSSTAALSLMALGVVFGDIGTSPLYALRVCFSGHGNVPVQPPEVLGVLSLVAWALILVVTLKYIVLVLRADNRGEGGILALMTLVGQGGGARRRTLVVTLGIIGAALLYGDGVITPAISVLSAIEGLEIVAPGLERLIVPVSAAALVLLFGFQRQGTQGVGRLFGPVMLVWFAVLAGMGLHWVLQRPDVLTALDPRHAVWFLGNAGWHAFFVLSAVFLVMTGAEALYADLGHFGKRPIRLAWLGLALPALLLNYFGQGALLLEQPSAIANPFYHLAPEWALVPLLLLATLATVVASQAIITGAFSLTTQAIWLRLAPRLAVAHTSEVNPSQIYLPFVNWGLALGTFLLIVTFRHSTELAGAYGIAVSLTMLITSILGTLCARLCWGWSWPRTLAVWTGFAVIDLAFVGANFTKLLEGGWVPLGIGLGVYAVFSTWRWGRERLHAELDPRRPAYADLAQQLNEDGLTRVPGTAIYMDDSLDLTPMALLENLEHNHVLHEDVVKMTILVEEVPHVPGRERVEVRHIADGFHQVIARYGFFEQPRFPEVAGRAKALGIDADLDGACVFLSRQVVVVGRHRSRWSPWRLRTLFLELLMRNARGATRSFQIPPDRVLEIGVQVDL